MSTDTETVEQILARMEAHGTDLEHGDVDASSYDGGYCVAAAAYARRLRAAIAREES